MLAACERHRVQLMDGVMFMHSRRLPALRQALDDGESVGRIRRIASQFSFNADEGFVAENIRGDSRLEPSVVEKLVRFLLLAANTSAVVVSLAWLLGRSSAQAGDWEFWFALGYLLLAVFNLTYLVRRGRRHYGREPAPPGS